MKNRIYILTFLCFPLFTSFAVANRGMIPVDPNVQIFEPHQRAMIAWNGTEEILLLSTDLSASEPTMVLEVLPLKTEPDVKKGDLETFQKATNLINSKLRKPTAFGKRNGDGDERIKTPGGEVTFHEKIGAHDISVTHLLNADGFLDWVKDYLKSIDIEKNVISDEMRKLIESYMNDDFDWFVFDVVSLSEETVTSEPIQYRFKTESLFYPLKITKTAKGSTTIELLILTPRLLRKFPGLPINRIRLRHDPITITNYELKELNEDMYDLLGQQLQMKLRIWEIEGDLEAFDADLIAY